jgi:predicted  nucleic acid-binding Zn-ribbon protein
MSSRLHFGDHRAFHRQVIQLTLAGAALALIGFILSKISGHAVFSERGLFDPGGVFTAATSAGQLIWMVAIVAGLGLAARPPERSKLPMTLALAVGFGLLGALVQRALVASPPVYPWFGMGVWGMAIGALAIRDLRDYRRFSVPLATGLTVVLATWVQQTYMAQLISVEYVPSFVAAPLQGALFGFLVGIGLVTRQLHVEHDHVSREFAQVKGQLSGEMLELAERAMTTYRRINEVLRDREDRGTPPDPKLIKAVTGLLMRVLELGRKWQEVEKEASRTSAEALTHRIDELDTKIDASKDRVARRQYEMARDALQAQLGYLRDISQNRERVLARVHNYLAALERLHLGVLNHKGADAAKFDANLGPMIDEIANIGQEMDVVAEALREVTDLEGETTRSPRATPSEPDASSDQEPSAELSASCEPGTSEPGTSEPGTSEPGTSEPGTSEPGASEPSASTEAVAMEGPEMPTDVAEARAAATNESKTDADPEAELARRAFE